MELRIISFDNSKGSDPFAYIENLYKISPEVDWTVDFGTIPNTHLREWKFADQYWKLYRGLKKGKSIHIGHIRYVISEKDCDIDSMICEIMDIICTHCEQTGHDYNLAFTDKMIQVFFIDLLKIYNFS